MYEKYTRQALPDRHYRELLGSALCVFNSNSAFMIENVLREDITDKYTWYELIDLEAGKIKQKAMEILGCLDNGKQIVNRYSEIVDMRNRIIHSYQITYDDQQLLCTKTKAKDGNRQFIISEEYLMEFIQKNEVLASLLHALREYLNDHGE